MTRTGAIRLTLDARFCVFTSDAINRVSTSDAINRVSTMGLGLISILGCVAFGAGTVTGFFMLARVSREMSNLSCMLLGA